MVIFWLTLASSASWFVSSLAGGGTPLILIPMIGFFLGPSAVPPVLTTGMLIGHPQRVFLYWREINWSVTAWYLPGAVIGSVLGAFTFTQIKLDWLSVLLAISLLASTLTYNGSAAKQSFVVRLWYFLPGGFIYAFLSGLIGSTGPLLNPLYLNYGLARQQLIATKSVNMLIVHIVKMITYGICGVLNPTYLAYGLLIGIAAWPGNWLGQIVLNRISEERFRQLVVGFVVLSSMALLWQY